MKSALGHYQVKTSNPQSYRGFRYVKRGKYYTARKIMEEMPSDKHRSRTQSITSTLYTSVKRIKEDIDQWYDDVEKSKES